MAVGCWLLAYRLSTIDYRLLADPQKTNPPPPPEECSKIGRAYGSFKLSRLAWQRIEIRRYKIYRACGSTTAMIGFFLVKKNIKNRLAVGC